MYIDLVTGQKGGVGKTLFARALAAWLNEQRSTWAGIDTDQENKFFSHDYPREVSQHTLYDETGRLNESAINDIVNAIAAAMESGTVERFVVDMGAAQLNALFGAFRETGLVNEIGGRLNLMLYYLLLDEPQSLSTLKNNVALLDDIAGAQWVVVKNQWKGRLAGYEDGRIIRPEMQARNAIEFVMPKMSDPENAVKVLDTSGLAMAEFIADRDPQRWAYRGRVKSFLDAMFVEFRQHRIAVPSLTAAAVPASKTGASSHAAASAGDAGLA